MFFLEFLCLYKPLRIFFLTLKKFQQGFPPHFQLPQNGMFDPSNNNNGGILDVNNPANFNMNGNCNSPMFRQSIQMNNNGFIFFNFLKFL